MEIETLPANYQIYNGKSRYVHVSLITVKKYKNNTDSGVIVSTQK
jgi:hypothetical protein